MIKRIILVLTIVFCLFSLQAWKMEPKVDSFAQTAFYYPQNSLAVTDTFEFRFSDCNLCLVPYAGFGYSVRFYGQADILSQSKALLYGPALRFGLSVVYRESNVSYQLSAGCEGVYSNFPTVLFKETEVSVVKNYLQDLFLKASFGFMWAKEDYSSKFAIGFGKCVK